MSTADTGHTQLRVPSASYADYRTAAGLLWGDAGRWAVDESERWNHEAFDGELPPLPVVIGLTSYGHVLGLCRGANEHRPLPRVTIHPREFYEFGLRHASHVVLHELLHAWLGLRGESAKHNGAPWCASIERLSERLFGLTITARAETNRRAETKQRRAAAGVLPRNDVAKWPHSILPAAVYEPREFLVVDTY